MENLIKTTEKIEVQNYPYGYTLKTTLFDEMEFNPKKGYRHITTTINPKNGRLNAPKKSTYSNLIVRYFDENNHVKLFHFDFNGAKNINKVMNFINDNFENFTTDEIKYFYGLAYIMVKLDIKANVLYCGASFENLKPIYQNVTDELVKGINTPTENFFNISIDINEIENQKQPDFNPFR